MPPDVQLIVVSFGCWRVSFSPNTGFVVSLVCAVDWPGYFGKETSPRGRGLGLGLPIGRRGAFRFPWERRELGLVCLRSVEERVDVRFVCIDFIFGDFFFTSLLLIAFNIYIFPCSIHVYDKNNITSVFRRHLKSISLRNLIKQQPRHIGINTCIKCSHCFDSK